MAYKDLNITPVTWDEIQQNISAVNPEFAELAKNWRLPSTFKLFKAAYKYGQKISNKGKLNLPTKDGSVVNLHSDVVPNELQDALSYSSLPLGFITKNTAEVYREVGRQRISPLAFFEPGVPLGLLETLEPPVSCCVRNVWDVVAGARSIFMLAKISDGVAHKKLQKETGIITPQPKDMFDHFAVFRDLYRAGAIKENWETEIVFLSKEWFEPDFDNLHWLKFYNFLHKYFFDYSGYSRNRPTTDSIIWDTFYEALMQTRQKPQPHIYETLRHLFSISCGVLPGFSPAVNNTSGPVFEIQKIYEDIYSLEKVPTIIAPKHFALNENYQPVYYSMNFVTSVRSLPGKTIKKSLSEDLFHLQGIVRYFSKTYNEGKIDLQNTFFEKILNSVEYSYFHIEPSHTVGILDPSKIPETDKNFLASQKGLSKKSFKHDALFLRGCIKISKRRNIELEENVNTPLS